MKRLLLSSLLSLSGIAGFAQGFSVGAKTGINNWFRTNYNESAGPVFRVAEDGPMLGMNNQVFARYQTKGAFAFEAGIAYSKRTLNEYDVMVGCIFEPSPYLLSAEQWTNRYLELNISAQVKLPTCCSNSCPSMKKLSHYIGVTASPYLVSSYIRRVYKPYTAEETTNKVVNDKINRLEVTAALNHSIIYTLNKEFNLISTVELRYVAPNYYYNAANTRASLSLGASYNIK